MAHPHLRHRLPHRRARQAQCQSGFRLTTRLRCLKPLISSPPPPPDPQVCSIVPGEAALEVAIDAPAREGEANDGITEYVAEALGLKKRAVVFVAGHKSRDKLLRVDGLNAAQVLERVMKYTGEGGG